MVEGSFMTHTALSYLQHCTPSMVGRFSNALDTLSRLDRPRYNQSLAQLNFIIQHTAFNFKCLLQSHRVGLGPYPRAIYHLGALVLQTIDFLEEHCHQRRTLEFMMLPTILSQFPSTTFPTLDDFLFCLDTVCDVMVGLQARDALRRGVGCDECATETARDETPLTTIFCHHSHTR